MAFAGVIVLATAGTLVPAQSASTGSLTGKLTDVYSKPLDGAALILRNDATGSETRAVTAKNGSYHFSGLTPGEYTLQAERPRSGLGQVAGILVSAGHEARVQVALELAPASTPAILNDAVRPASVQPPQTTALLAPPEPRAVGAMANAAIAASFAADKPSTVSATAQVEFRLEPTQNFAWSGARPVWPAQTAPPMVADASRKSPKPDPAPSTAPEAQRMAATLPPPVVLSSIQGAVSQDLHTALLAGVAIKPLAINLAVLSAGGRAVAQTCAALAAGLQQALESRTVAAAHAVDSEPSTPAATLTGEQLQALPLHGRHWEAFALDTYDSGATEADAGTESIRGSARAAASVTVDGATTRLAFGGRAGGRLRSSSLMSAGANEAAIREVRTTQIDSLAPDASGVEHPAVETRQGSEGLHGQGFFFDRQNLWGAQNPFTQWVKETAPGTQITSPVFTAFPYTPPDREDRWGIGIGSHLRRERLFWFAAYDGSRRNDPGVSTVRHPDDFFSQPSNDEMQVLSSRLGLSSANPIAEGLAAYSGMLEQLSGLLGPAPRTASQWVGFGRLDWHAAERHRFTLEGTGARWNSPGGGFTRASETYGNHSFGSSRASEMWLLARWEAFVTPNLLSVTQGSAGRHILSEGPETPSPFEQTLNVNAWRQLPQMTVDSRYGFTIGNPARFGSGSYPDEHLYEVQEALNWVHGPLLVKAGADWRHNADATSMVRNHTGTYYYSSVENFASDALVFAKYGLNDALDPMHQHNCDQRGRAWRDSDHQLNGRGPLPCYSYYSQTMGPTDWHLSTNDLAAYGTAQWQPAHRFVLSAALRWQREILPPPIALVDNPELPLTQRLPNLGNEWAPRFSLAWGTRESRWPTLQIGYGMYYGRTQNSVLETVLSQTGSLKGDLNFFMRPTDNLLGGGAPPFPYVFAGEPATVVKPGAVQFARRFVNPEIHQGELSLQERLPGHVQVTATALVSLGRRLPVTIDSNFDLAINPKTITYGVVDGLNAGPIKTRQITVPFFASWPAYGVTPASSGRQNPNYQQITELISRANSTYEAAMLRVSRYSRRGLSFHARYTYGHAMDWNPNESAQVTGSNLLDPTDFRQEYGTSNLDIRHSASAMVIWESPWKLNHIEGRLANGWMLSGIGQFRSGLPYTMRTAGSIPREFEASGAAIIGLGPGMNGSGGDNRVYGVGRNTYRYPFTWKADVRLGRKFNLGPMRQLELLAESFNLFNHQNVTRLETVGYTIAPGGESGSLPTLNFLTGLKTGQTEFGKPLDVNATDFFRPRQFDFGMRMRF